MCFTKLIRATQYQVQQSLTPFVYRKDRNVHGGGVMIAVNSNFIHYEIDFAFYKEVVEVVLPSSDPREGTIVLCIYNPPGSDLFF